MNNVIISLGCSFLTGIGNWERKALIEYEKGKLEEPLLHAKSYKNFLNYSIGTQLARNLNFDEHHNFSLGGSSVKHQLIHFFKHFKPQNFKNKNVVFYYGITYPNRNCTFINDNLRTIHVDEERDSEFYRSFGETNTQVIQKDTIQNQLVYIESVRSLCEAYNWKLILHPMVWDKTYYYQQKLSNNQYRNFQEVWVDKWLTPYEDEYLSFCGHPNTDGYKIWADNLIDYVSKFDFEIPEKPNRDTIYCINYNEELEIEAKRNDFKQGLII